MHITVGQALLLLIEKYQHQLEKRQELEAFYLSGFTATQQEALDEYLRDDILKDYDISRFHGDIDKDPTRRYFETHLCFETLRDCLKNISRENLKAVNRFYFEELKRKLNKTSVRKIKCVLDVKSPLETKESNLEKEISDALCRLEKRKQVLAKKDAGSLLGNNVSNPSEFNTENIEKMQLFLHAAFMGIVYGKIVKDSPMKHEALSIYRPQHKGRIFKKDNATVTTMNYGIMKGNMPIPQNDVILADSAFLYMKPSEQSTYDVKATWPQQNFSLLVHSFSNGISSTIFNQLKSIMQGLKCVPTSFAWVQENMQLYFTGLIATLMFHSGGHTLNEFTAPFSLKEIIEIYRKTLNVDLSDLTLNKMFYENNQKAFRQALESTMIYNHLIINRTKVNHEILTNLPELKSVLYTATTQKDLTLKMDKKIDKDPKNSAPLKCQILKRKDFS